MMISGTGCIDKTVLGFSHLSLAAASFGFDSKGCLLAHIA